MKINTTRPGSGGLPDEVEKEESHFYYFDFEKGVASPMDGIEIPLNPFMGVMALAPSPETGRVSSIPPGPFGGNLDLKHLIKGTTLYLPVSVPGGMFTTGDAHATQGNGEVSGTAIETSMTLTAEFIVHKNETIEVPRAETKDHFIAMGLDPDLNMAMKNAIRETIQMIREKMDVTYNRAFSIASTAVDFEVTQVVDRTEGVHAMIPKNIFKNQKFEYWYA